MADKAKRDALETFKFVLPIIIHEDKHAQKELCKAT